MWVIHVLHQTSMIMLSATQECHINLVFIFQPKHNEWTQVKNVKKNIDALKHQNQNAFFRLNFCNDLQKNLLIIWKYFIIHEC